MLLIKESMEIIEEKYGSVQKNILTQYVINNMIAISGSVAEETEKTRQQTAEQDIFVTGSMTARL